jgi:hypothetical protein
MDNRLQAPTEITLAAMAARRPQRAVYHRQHRPRNRVAHTHSTQTYIRHILLRQMAAKYQQKQRPNGLAQMAFP